MDRNKAKAYWRRFTITGKVNGQQVQVMDFNNFVNAITEWEVSSRVELPVKPEIADIEIIDWHKRKFATADHWDVYRKLLEEVGELGEAIARETYGNIELEFGDVEICLIVLASKLRVYKKSAVAKSHAKNLEKVTLKK